MFQILKTHRYCERKTKEEVPTHIQEGFDSVSPPVTPWIMWGLWEFPIWIVTRTRPHAFLYLIIPTAFNVENNGAREGRY